MYDESSEYHLYDNNHMSYISQKEEEEIDEDNSQMFHGININEITHFISRDLIFVFGDSILSVKIFFLTTAEIY
jgi:hypothetical protein